jgi:hypothetical protein
MLKMKVIAARNRKDWTKFTIQVKGQNKKNLFLTRQNMLSYDSPELTSACY